MLLFIDDGRCCCFCCSNASSSAAVVVVAAAAAAAAAADDIYVAAVVLSCTAYFPIFFHHSPQRLGALARHQFTFRELFQGGWQVYIRISPKIKGIIDSPKLSLCVNTGVNNTPEFSKRVNQLCNEQGSPSARPAATQDNSIGLGPSMESCEKYEIRARTLNPLLAVFKLTW